MACKESCSSIVILKVTMNTYQAKQPTKATNLSKSAAPTQLRTVQAITMANLNAFFCHLTRGSALPLRVNRPFSMILTAGKNWRGTESRIASAYKNWTCLGWIKHRCQRERALFFIRKKRTDCTVLFLGSRLRKMTVWISDPKARYARMPAPPNRTRSLSMISVDGPPYSEKQIRT